ncbi:hypothetical protein QZH41_013059 [Actinostola sp. cb2023]|nr:hypothetical protein QZH41_013059 [Actinostola sp. cb2023]
MENDFMLSFGQSSLETIEKLRRCIAHYRCSPLLYIDCPGAGQTEVGPSTRQTDILDMYHMGFHLEAQRQQRTIDRKKDVQKKIEQSKKITSDAENRQETRSGNRPETRTTTAHARADNPSQNGAKPQSQGMLGQYQRIGQPVMGQRVFSKPEQYENRWVNKRFNIRHDRNLVPLPFRKVDVTHQ